MTPLHCKDMGWSRYVCILYNLGDGRTKGQDFAVQRALKHIEASIETDLILMTDADAMLEADTVSNLMQWFADPSIGCVGASPKRVGQRMEEEKHREMFSMVRNLE